MNNDEYLKFYEDRVKKINNELEIRKNPTDPLLKQCCKCKQVNRTKYNRWLCPYCGFINEPGDKTERKEIDIYTIGRWITTVITCIGFLICFIAYYGFWQGVLIGGFISSFIAWIAGFLWPYVAVIIIGIIGIAYFIYKAS